MTIPPQPMSSVRIECVGQERCRLGESPLWDEKEGALLYVDITGRRVCRWSPGTGQAQAVPVGKEPLENPPVCGAACREPGCARRQPHGADLETFPPAWVSSVASPLGDTRYRPDLVLGIFLTTLCCWVMFEPFLFPISCPQFTLFCSHFVPEVKFFCWCSSDVDDQWSQHFLY